MDQINSKLEQLNQRLLSFERVAVAFSGGTDSAFLAAAAHRVLGKNAVAVTAYSETLADSERQDTIAIAKEIGIEHVLVAASELNNAQFVGNPPDRCYFCKKERFGILAEWAESHGFPLIIEGTNADDLGDYRPGIQSLNEMDNVRSPLLETGFTKSDIRNLSRQWGLPTWNKPAAACLASRLSYGLPITKERLKQVEDAEEFIRQFCSGQVRVRHHEQLARIEVEPSCISVVTEPSNSALIIEKLKSLGFTYITLDLSGYHMGSMNQTLK